jgi:hypothetical protein
MGGESIGMVGTSVVDRVWIVHRNDKERWGRDIITASNILSSDKSFSESSTRRGDETYLRRCIYRLNVLTQNYGNRMDRRGNSVYRLDRFLWCRDGGGRWFSCSGLYVRGRYGFFRIRRGMVHVIDVSFRVGLGRSVVCGDPNAIDEEFVQDL